jgi:ATP-dependent Clp endopeptidase proteolytic subunit ClpP
MNPWLTVVSFADADEIHINGFIGTSWWDDTGTSEKQFLTALAKIPEGRKINLLINSEGGSIQDGLGMHAAIRRRSGDITAIITGYALSIASYFPLAASKVITPPGSIWMVHKPWSGQLGNADDMRKAAQMLDKHEEAMISEYVRATGQTRERIAADLSEETWLTGEEAVIYGLADELLGEPVTPADLSHSPAHSRFRMIPVALGGKTPPPMQKLNQILMNETATAEIKAPAQSSPAPTATGSQADKAAVNASTALNVEALASALAGVQAQLAREKTGRIAKAVDQAVLDGKIPVNQAPAWKKRAEADETILDDLANMESRRPGTDPATGVHIEVGASGFAIDLIRKKPRAERRAFMEENWRDLQQAEARRQFSPPMGANTGTGDATLIGTMLSEVTITVLQVMLAPLRALTTDVGISPMAPRQPVVVSLVTAGGTAQSNATNFEDLTNFVGTVAPVTVTPAQLTSGGHITNAERNSGFRMSLWAEIKAAELAQKVMAAVTAVITVANFPAAPIVVADTAFTVTDLNKAWGQLAKAPTKYAILGSTYIAKLLPVDQNSLSVIGGNWPGWAGIFANDQWTGATALTQGFICHPQAIAAAIGFPATSPNAANAGARESTIIVPGIDIPVLLTDWYANSSRNDWQTLDVVFGAAKADGTAGIILKSA